jgi:hypothetical protein
VDPFNRTSSAGNTDEAIRSQFPFTRADVLVYLFKIFSHLLRNRDGEPR